MADGKFDHELINAIKLSIQVDVIRDKELNFRVQSRYALICTTECEYNVRRRLDSDC